MTVTAAVSRKPAAFALGERIPAAVHAPSDPSELAAIVRPCDGNGRSVVFFGGGTQQGIGATPARYDEAVVMSKISAVIPGDARDMTIAAEGGCTIAMLNATLAARGQFVAFDAPFATRATVGGTLAAGWLGPRRETFGRPRDFTIGTSIVLADGTLAHAGGMVVKNSTGYDLSKLYVGSLGTLGAIVRANFKTRPIPRARRIAIAALPDGSREHARANLAALNREPTAAVFIRGFEKEITGLDGGDGRAFILLEGSESFVDAATRDVRSALGAAGVPETRLVDRDAPDEFARLLDAYGATLGSRSTTYRSYGLAGDSAIRFDAFERVAADCKLTCETLEDLRTGDVLARLSTRVNAAFAERIVAFDAMRRTALGAARVTAAPPGVHGQLDVWGAPPDSLLATRALKARFDPNGTLAPGRLVGGI